MSKQTLTHMTQAKFYKFGGLTIPVVNPEPCFRLVQIGKGLPLTCKCSRCAARRPA